MYWYAPHYHLHWNGIGISDVSMPPLPYIFATHCPKYEGYHIKDDLGITTHTIVEFHIGTIKRNTSSYTGCIVIRYSVYRIYWTHSRHISPHKAPLLPGRVLQKFEDCANRFPWITQCLWIRSACLSFMKRLIHALTFQYESVQLNMSANTKNEKCIKTNKCFQLQCRRYPPVNTDCSYGITIFTFIDLLFHCVFYCPNRWDWNSFILFKSMTKKK